MQRSITFRELLDALEGARPQAEVRFDFGNWGDWVLVVGPRSDREYLAIVRVDPPATVAEVLQACRSAQQDREVYNMPVWAAKWRVDRVQPAVVEVVDSENEVILKTAFL
jgi:hypothetical protein